jgi:hypothetical protein
LFLFYEPNDCVENILVEFELNIKKLFIISR